MDEELAAELARMAAEDQRIRRPPKGGARTMVRRLDPKTAMDYRRIDAENATRLGQILSERGWPGKSLVGEHGAHDAWLIAQHADHQPRVQHQALELLTAAVARGEAKPREFAGECSRRIDRMHDGEAEPTARLAHARVSIA
ncbi:hypothetical protein BH20ACT19_BH20ACT19_13520 [soil metagenome]